VHRGPGRVVARSVPQVEVETGVHPEPLPPGAPGGGQLGVDAGEPRGHGIRGQAHRMPALPAGGPAQGRGPVATDDDRRVGPAEGLGRRDHVGEAPVPAGHGGRPRRPQGGHHGQELVGQRAPLLVGDAQRGVLLGQAAHADAHHQPAPAEVVEGGQLLGQRRRVQVGQHQHAGAQLHPAGPGRSPGQDGECVMVGTLTETFADVADVEHVVGDPDRVETESLAVDGDLDDLGGVGHAHVVGQGETEAHRTSWPPSRRARTARSEGPASPPRSPERCPGG
jgi:hypothetical protein